uniref:WGS project CAEQ00000000 data, annotated contig 317 n=1 Tax=Trypanosoma congolense (strain IL3000) TaxID=1068625 RepID=F9WEV3_TRYCI|nr:unnamed protein product [Trypanosoma congolense IL3000]
MLLCLRRIHQSQRETCAGADHSAKKEVQGLQRTVFEAVASSERCLFNFHSEKKDTKTNGVTEVVDRKADDKRIAKFMSDVVQRHLRAVTFESALATSLRHRQQENDGTVALAPEADNEMFTESELSIGELLWMNRTMALGATCTMLEGLHPRSGDFTSSVVGLTDEGLASGAASFTETQKTVRFLRQSYPALRAVLFDTGEEPVTSFSETTDGTVNQPPATISQTQPISHTPPQHQQSEKSGKRKRSDEADDGEGQVPVPKKQSFSFTVKIDQSILKSQKQTDSAIAAPAAAAEAPSAATDQSRRPVMQCFEKRSKFSFSQPSSAPAQPSTQPDQTLVPRPADVACVPEQPSISLSPSDLTRNCQGSHTAPSAVEMPENAQSTPPVASSKDFRLGKRPAPCGRGDNNGESETSVGNMDNVANGFITAGEQLMLDVKAKRTMPSNLPTQRRVPALGLRRSAFITPFQSHSIQPKSGDSAAGDAAAGGATPPTLHLGGVLNSINRAQRLSPEPKRKQKVSRASSNDSDGGDFPASLLLPDGTVPPILQSLDARLVAQVAAEILEHSGGNGAIGWDDIAGLEHAKRSVEEAVVWPLRRPDLFVGLRDPPRGLLLFGPPGTGKTMIARAIANRAQCTFLNISASSVMSKWMGDGEKLVRCLFAVATVKQPSVIFIDEVDSLLSTRSEGEMDAVRRVKTEFLVQLDGVGTNQGDRVLLIGATNRPDELDEAARRRMEKRLYIPLPHTPARIELIRRLLNTMVEQYAQQREKANKSPGDFSSLVHAIDEESIVEIANATDGYSGADIKQLCREAAMCPLREVTMKLTDVSLSDLRPIQREDFLQALRHIRPSVGAAEVQRYVEWNKQFGSFSAEEGTDASQGR